MTINKSNQPVMEDFSDITKQVEEIGFICQKCGRCCMPVEENSDLVMVTPFEIRSISLATGISWDEIAEPYPETIRDGKGRIYTMGWCLRRRPDGCRFLQNSVCSIYNIRPSICRTYPFTLEGRHVLTGPCPGLGQKISHEDACRISRLLVSRANSEKYEEEAIRQVLQDNIIPEGIFVVIDSEGIRSYPKYGEPG